MTEGSPAAAVVLAAGLGRRFGGRKLLAALDGRPLLQHVLDVAAEVRLEPVIVVLSQDVAAGASGLGWRSEIRVVNREPERGLASSLRLGLKALALAAPRAQRAVILLGDQPRLAAAQVAVLLDVPYDPERPMVVPRYADGRPGNPVLLARPAWPIAAGLEGDRGMSQVFGERPELVRYVDVPGTNPDVDTRQDLQALQR